ncbi:MAG: hypothetical protein H7175_27685 [Burkholderiales bacterium]|nr:hypothetical protein [Anaerolineae bacterium]
MPKKKKVTDKTKVTDLTVDEFKVLMSGLLQEAFLELKNASHVPTHNKETKPEVKDS